MHVLSILKWGDGNITKRTLDWSNREAVRKFSAVAHGCLRSGGQVITTAYSDKPEDVSVEDHAFHVEENLAGALQDLSEVLLLNTI
jgi:hypothetical protein